MGTSKNGGTQNMCDVLQRAFSLMGLTMCAMRLDGRSRATTGALSAYSTNGCGETMLAGTGPSTTCMRSRMAVWCTCL